MGSIGSNIQFNPANLLHFFTILARFLSFASFELPRFIGPHTVERVGFLKQNLWVSPFAVFVGIVGIAQPVVMIIMWFSKKHTQKDWRGIKYFTLFTVLIVYLSFMFSIKGPLSHTFYIVLPVAMIFSFYCWSPLLKKHGWRIFAAIFVICGIIFHLGLAIAKAPERSLYKDRSVPALAIKEKNYRILGERRSPYW